MSGNDRLNDGRSEMRTDSGSVDGVLSLLLFKEAAKQVRTARLLFARRLLARLIGRPLFDPGVFFVFLSAASRVPAAAHQVSGGRLHIVSVLLRLLWTIICSHSSKHTEAQTEQLRHLQQSPVK